MKRKRDLLIGASLLALIVSLGGNGRDDAHILKFTRDGTFLAQYRKPRRAPGDAAATGWRPSRYDRRQPFEKGV